MWFHRLSLNTQGRGAKISNTGRAILVRIPTSGAMAQTRSPMFIVNNPLLAGVQVPTEDGDLRKKIYEHMGKSPSGDDTTDTFDDVTNAGCAAWLAGLASSNAGQKVLDHLNHLDAAPHMRPSSAFEQTLAFRRVFMYALSKTSAPFGFPKKFPKYIVIANFSGERLLLYSSNPILIARMTMNFSSPNVSEYDGVQQIIRKAATTENASVLLCYSMPFQMGVESVYWECRLLSKQGLRYVDNDLSCSVWDRHACVSTTTNDCESQRLEILDSQVEAFSNHMTACDLDVEVEKIDGISSGEAVDPMHTKLVGMVTMLKNERRRVMDDHKNEIHELKRFHAEELEKTRLFMKTTFEKQAMDDTKACDRVKELEVELNFAKSGALKRDQQYKVLKADEFIKDEARETATRASDEKIKEMSKEIQALKAHVRKVEHEKTTSLKKQGVVHQQLHDEAERKLQRAKQSEAVANESMTQVEFVQRAFEVVSNEKDFLTNQMDSTRKKMLSYRLRLGFQLKLNERLNDMTREARLEHVECIGKLKVLQNEHSEVCAEYKSEVDALMDMVASLKVDLQAAASSTKPPETSVTDTHVQTDILPETLLIGELESASVKYKDEIVQLKIELGKSKAKVNKRNPSSVINVDANCLSYNSPMQFSSQNVPHPASSDSTAFNPDGVLEGTIQQLHISLNTITDLARQCKTHEQSAREAWSKVNAYGIMNPQTMHHAGAYPMQFMYVPHHPHHAGHYT